MLRARPGAVHLRGGDKAPTRIWGYEGTVPGPTLRVKQGEEVRVRLINQLPQPTAIHWHGLRLPNAMDGVPHLTQKPVEPGESFDYRFVAPDAGTFWYHSHFRSSEQLGRGLYGALIVDEHAEPGFDRDVLILLDDWRLADDGQIHESFGMPMDASHAGRLGQYLTANSQDLLDIPVRPNERLRLRLVNAANARVMRLRLDGHRATVIALDGQPAQPFDLPNGTLTLPPGSRADLVVDAQLEAGSKADFVLEYGRGKELAFASLVYRGDPVRTAPLVPPSPLPPNPLPERMRFDDALRLDIPLDGGAMSAMMRERMMGGVMRGHGGEPMFWALADRSSSGHDGPPLFRVARGRTVVLEMVNRTAFPHAMHVHGHHFRVLEGPSGERWKPYWLDNVLVDVRETERIAFVADNPGKWMIHCHMIEHQESGMAAWFAVD
ncbi:MAG TPA: multicopper oxidase family protein [Burkholderiales bacterium]|nr:multicopper oxidase family protein [Burkholderiales bacterium]